MNQAVWVMEMYKIVNFQISFIIAWVTVLMKKFQNVTYVIPHHPWGIGSRTPPQIPRSEDAQVLVSYLHLTPCISPPPIL